MARIRIKEETKYDRQMGAIIGKMLSYIESLPGIRTIDPFEHDRLRKKCIKVAWECYLVGRNRGLEESENEPDTAEHRAVSS